MRRYPIIFILLLSILLPLQVAASTLLSMQSCPEQANMAQLAGASTGAHAHPDTHATNAAHADHETHTSNGTHTSNATHNCCDPAEQPVNCQQMHNCHSCHISYPLLTASIPKFIVVPHSTLHLSLITPALGVLDPATVWRPPTNV